MSVPEPVDGESLCLWARQVEWEFELNMIRFLCRLGRRRGWHYRIRDWEPAEVREAYAIARKALKRKVG